MSHAAVVRAAPPDPLRIHTYEPELTRLFAVVGGVLSGTGLATWALRSLHPALALPGTLAIASVCFLASVACVAHGLATTRVALELHRDGFILRSPFVTTLVAYAEIRTVRYEHAELVVGAVTLHRGCFEVELHDGRVVRPSLQLERIDEAVAFVLERTSPASPPDDRLPSA